MPSSSRPGTGRSRACVAPPARTRASKFVAEFVDRNVETHVGVGLEGDALFRHQVEPALDEPFLHLEVGNAVGQQSADAVGPLEHGDGVTHFVQVGLRMPVRPGLNR